ncbi:MAG TPA: hypothetical protein VG605_16670 [Puia sp.]|nr:hypothetical protein [Puia sp.]
MRFPLLIAILFLSIESPAMSPAGSKAGIRALPAPGTRVLPAPGTRTLPAPENQPLPLPLTAQPADTLPAGPSLIAAFHFIDSAFNKSSLEFEMLGPGMPAGLDSVLFRFNNTIAANKQWFIEYKNQHPGGTLPYNPKFGVTPEEYLRIQNYASTPVRLVPVDSQQVSIIRMGGLIRFKCAGEIRFLDYLYFDPVHLQACYGGDTIPFVGRSGASSSPYGPWKGFKWRLEKTNITVTFENVTAHVVEVDLGMPPAGDKLFIRILYQDLKADKTTSGIQLAGFLR